MTTRSTIAVVALAIGSLALVAGCGSSDGASSDPTVTTGAVTAMTTVPGGTAPSTTASTARPDTTAPNGSMPPTTVAPVPGEPCAPGSSPDCISPEGDGQYVYLLGGAACMASPIGGPMCSDLDGDGKAGYPDAG